MKVDKTLISYIGYVAGTCTTFAFIPQVYSVFKTKNVKALSLITLIVFLVGQMIWITYGILDNNKPIILFCSITLFLYIYLIYAKTKY